MGENYDVYTELAGIYRHVHRTVHRRHGALWFGHVGYYIASIASIAI